MDECQAESTSSARLWRRDDPDYAFRYADQDVFNAVVAARVGADRVAALDAGLCPGTPFAGLAGRRRRGGARRPTTTASSRSSLHHALSPKPWQEPAYDGVYSQLLRRLLIGPGVAIPLERRRRPAVAATRPARPLRAPAHQGPRADPLAGRQVGGPGRMTETAFYCVADERYFLGAVGLVNSLRLLGHGEPIVLLDCGLTGEQRDLLGARGGADRGARRPPAVAAQDGRPAREARRRDGPPRHRHGRDAPARRAVRARRVGAGSSPSPTPPTASTPTGESCSASAPARAAGPTCQLGGAVRRPRARRRGPRPARRPPVRRSTSSAPSGAQTSPATRFATPTRTCSTRSSRRASSRDRLDALDSRLAPTPPFTGLAVADEARCAARTPTATEPFLVHHHVVRPVARADPPRRLLAPAAPAADRRRRRDPGARGDDPAVAAQRAARVGGAASHQRTRAPALARAGAARPQARRST